MLVGLALIGLLLPLLRANQPFDVAKGGTVSADQYGYSFLAFDAHGYGALRFQPSLFFRAEDRSAFSAYDHHPWLAYGYYYAAWSALGGNERSVRLATILLIALGALGLFVLLRDAVGPRAGAWAAVALLFLPMTVVHGGLVDSIFFSVALIPWVALSWFRFQAGRSFVPLLVCLVLAGMTNWYAYGLVPAIWTDLLLFDQGVRRRRIRVGVLVGALFAATLLAHLAFVAWSSRSFDGVRHLLSFYGGTFEGEDIREVRALGGHKPAILDATWSHLWEGLGLGFLGTTLLGALATFRARQRPWVRVVVFAAVAGVAPCIAFWSRFAGHDFLILPVSTVVAVLFAVAVDTLSAVPRRKLLLGLAGGFLLANGLLGIGKRQQIEDAQDVRTLRTLGAFVPEKSVLLLPTVDYRPGLRFYAERPTLPLINDRGSWDLAMRTLAGSGADLPMAWLMVREQTLPSLPWLSEVALELTTAVKVELDGEPWLRVRVDVPRALESARR